MVIIAAAAVFFFATRRRGIRKKDTKAFVISEEYYLEDGDIFMLVLEHLTENKKLPYGVSENAFYKYLFRFKKNRPDLVRKYFEKLSDVIEIIPVSDERSKQHFLDYYFRAEFSEFKEFWDLLKSPHPPFNFSDEDAISSYFGIRLKNLKKEDFSSFSEAEMQFYQENAKEYENRTNMIKLGDMFMEKKKYADALIYYRKVIEMPQEQDRPYKSTIRKLAEIHEVLGNISLNLYYLTLLHYIDRSHKLAEDDFKRALKNHHLSSYYAEMMEKIKDGEKVFTDYVKEIFANRNIRIS